MQREDDHEDTVKRRLDVYNKETLPLKEFYEQAGLLLNFEVKTGMEDLSKLQAAISDFLDEKPFATQS